ncbi:hypothetical protein B7486_49580 [cyanobacterium TDX16]|nr:hypothetical protein B7486_49580 [cyanobacterium TDX16]
MKLINLVKSLFTGFFRKASSPWWVEINTSMPQCIYYFGPFSTFVEAKASSPGYVEDLDREGAEEITVVIKRCAPTQLTLCIEEES